MTIAFRRVTLSFLSSICLVNCSIFLPSVRAESSNDVALASQLASDERTLPAPADAREAELLPATVPQPAAATDTTNAGSRDLWQRIRSGFGITDLSNDLVTRHLGWYANRPAYMNRMVERSKRYLHYIVGEVERRGMPTELALLPFIESAYNPVAYSRSHAAGIWQIIPSTGRDYKLEQNWWYDGRRDIIAATGAALDYLEVLYRMHGDWYLALASYNWGEGSVGRAIKKNRQRGLPTDYESLRMPAEPRNYVPKLQAIKNIIADPELFGLRIDDIPNEPYFTALSHPGDIDVALAAKFAEMPLDEFRALNPAHRRPIVTAAYGSGLLVPNEKIDIFTRNLIAHDAPLTSWQVHRLEPGQRVAHVAKALGVPLGELLRVNGWTKHSRVPAGTLILIPRDDADGAVAAAMANAEAAIPAAGKKQGRAARHGSPSKRARYGLHTVRRGDTLSSIAEHYRVSVHELKANNRLRGNRVLDGQKLRVPRRV
jgi:membrane-bound lytic murein transglycosylase D